MTKKIMMKIPFKEINEQLDLLFFSPFHEDESVEMRAEKVEEYVRSSGWTWNELINRMADLEMN